ncbi:DNA (cytosine-5)-methyltransferase CMT2-like [Forsythia ovata]|uniref:DNA (Cytosine-5)-methyltransferase CMT2-like n=1 Tax=Forsythia ovata TaxID=205694 RepID=A0ABD1WNA1_9LAMI
MAEGDHHQVTNPALSPPPPRLDPNPYPNSDPSTPTQLQNGHEAPGKLEISPKSEEFMETKLLKQKFEMLKSLDRNSRRRSPRLVENGGGESSGKTANSGKPPLKRQKTGRKVSFFIGDPVPTDEARRRWPWRYEENKGWKITNLLHSCRGNVA